MYNYRNNHELKIKIFMCMYAGIQSYKNIFCILMSAGSYLFKAEKHGDTRALTLNILIRDFKSADSLYFRVHPTFIKCIQAAMSKLRNDGTQVKVK